MRQLSKGPLRPFFVHLQKKDGVPDKPQSAVGQLRIWAENVGAHRSGCQSLDYRLPEATRFRGHVGDLLRDCMVLKRVSRSEMVKRWIGVGILDRD